MKVIIIVIHADNSKMPLVKETGFLISVVILCIDGDSDSILLIKSLFLVRFI